MNYWNTSVSFNNPTAPPQIESMTPSSKSIVGYNNQLKAVFTGDLPATVRWFHNDVLIKEEIIQDNVCVRWSSKNSLLMSVLIFLN